jgi:hypothetical protein
MTKKSRPITDELSDQIRYEVERLLRLEDLERSIEAQKSELAEIRKEYRDRIKELEGARDQVLEDLERFRLGNRALPLEGDVGKPEPGADG